MSRALTKDVLHGDKVPVLPDTHYSGDPSAGSVMSNTERTVGEGANARAAK